MAAADGRVVRGAPADAACGDGCAAVSSDVTAAGGGGLRDVGDVAGNHCRGEGTHRDGFGGLSCAAVLVGASDGVGGG